MMRESNAAVRQSQWRGLGPLEARLLMSTAPADQAAFVDLLDFTPAAIRVEDLKATVESLAQPGQIHGMVWQDLNGDGQFEPALGDKPQREWTVYVDLNLDGHLNNSISGEGVCDRNADEPCTVTDASGRYVLADLQPRVYAVREVLNAGWRQTSPVPILETQRVATGLHRPVYVTSPPGDMNRLFIIEQHTGKIKILDLNTGQIKARVFMDVDGLSRGNEQGLLGLAFHPDYASNGFFYINFTASNGTTNIVRHQISSLDPDVADVTSAMTVMTIKQPYSNHNGGWIGFGPDGFLYIASGDGGSGHDPGNRAQDTTGQLLGNMLRIDVNGDDFPNDPSRNYAIPPANPFVDVQGDDEIWAYGLRNPWRASFDRLTADLYIGDVGQSSREEIDFQPASSPGGENYGWRRREGRIATPTGGIGESRPPKTVDPIYDYRAGSGPNQGHSVTGGYVYRGSIKELRGKYFFGDYVSEQIWSIEHNGTDETEFTNWTTTLKPDQSKIDEISSFGEDGRGELYIVDLGTQSTRERGEVFKIVQASKPPKHIVRVDSGQVVSDRDFGNRFPGDVNGDGTVNTFDLALVLNNWGNTVPLADGRADGSDDGVVDAFDLAFVLNAWGGKTDSSRVARAGAVADMDPFDRRPATSKVHQWQSGIVNILSGVNATPVLLVQNPPKDSTTSSMNDLDAATLMG